MNNISVSFSQVCKSLTVVDDGYQAHLPDGWLQGRTAYGGITAGLGLAAARHKFPDLPSLRSMLVNFTGPVFGTSILQPVCLRQGKSVTTVQVTTLSEGKVAAQIIFTFGGSRDSRLDFSGTPQSLERSLEEYDDYALEGVVRFVPNFFQNFDVLLVAGGRPASGAQEGHARVLARHKNADSRTGIESLVTIADVLPPAAFTMAHEVAPVSSVTWMFNLLTDDPVTDDGWWHIESRATAARNGYSSQHMKVWSMGGELMAEGMQSVALFF